jgi:hypothetical protein
LLHAIEFPPALREIVFSTDADIDRMHAAAEAEYLRRLRALVPARARIVLHRGDARERREARP